MQTSDGMLQTSSTVNALRPKHVSLPIDAAVLTGSHLIDTLTFSMITLKTFQYAFLAFHNSCFVSDTTEDVAGLCIHIKTPSDVEFVASVCFDRDGFVSMCDSSVNYADTDLLAGT